MKRIIKNIFLILNEREKKKLIQLIIFDTLASLLDILFLAVLLYLVRFYIDPNHAVQKNYFTFLNRYTIWPIAIFFLLFSLKNLFGFNVAKMQFRFVYSVASRLSENNMHNYLSGNYMNYVENDSSVHIRRIGQEPIEFGHFILGGFQQIISQIILIVIAVTATLMLNPSLFFLLFLILTPPVILAAWLVKKKSNYLRMAGKKINEKNLQHLQEAISGFIESNTYGSNDFFAKRYYTYQTKFNDFLARQQSMVNMPSRLIEVFAVLGLLLLVVINSLNPGMNAVQIVTIGTFMAAAYKIIPGVVKILNCFGQIKTYGFVIESLVKEKKSSIKIEGRESISAVEFEHVDFSYDQKLIIKDFSLRITPGDFIGISGISGKGKTTLANLLLGFIEPQFGRIFINGNLADFAKRQAYWNDIAYTKQQPFLIHDTILKNIVLNEKAHDQLLLEHVIHITGIDELINQSPEGVNKMITENGKNISGGQRKRMMMARALYKQANLLILDEPFSELDALSEKRLLNHLKSLCDKGKMIVFISHNKESLLYCNKIISLDERITANIYHY